jgi:hypothetical protein
MWALQFGSSAINLLDVLLELLKHRTRDLPHAPREFDVTIRPELPVRGISSLLLLKLSLASALFVPPTILQLSPPPVFLGEDRDA